MLFRIGVCYVAHRVRIHGVPAKFFMGPLMQRGRHAAILRAALGAQRGKQECRQFATFCRFYADVGAVWGPTKWMVGDYPGRYGVVTRHGQES